MTHQITSNGKVALVMYPQEILALMREVRENHPQLQETLQKQESQYWEVCLAEIAAYVNVILDAWYSPEDVIRLCALLREKLIQKRLSGIILPESTQIH
jgi:hypothetical protein